MEKQTFRIAFYIRVSTDEQAKDGFWLDFQKADLEGMMNYRWEHHGWIHEKEWEYVDDGYTGADLNRPAYKRMIEDVRKGKFDIIAVWKIDRLSRSLSHLLSSFEMLQEHKVGFFSLKENIDFSGPIGKLTFQIFGALAEFERETIKMRTREGKNASARRGNFVISSPPFWYQKIQTTGKITKSLRIIPEEAEWVKKIFDMAIGWMTLNGIARHLNENKVWKGMWGLKRYKFTQWYGDTIRAILEDTTYIWSAIYKPKNDKWEIEEIPIPVPEIVHPLTFEIAQSALKKISENSQRWWGENKYLLSRKIVDVETGKVFVWYQRTKWWHGYRRKGFTDHRGIKHKNTEIAGQSLDDFVWGHIRYIISDPQRLFEIYKRQSINDSNYRELLEEQKKKDKIIQESEAVEFTIEQMFLSWKYNENKRDRLVNEEIEKRRALEKRIAEIDVTLNSIVKAEATKTELELFAKNLDVNIENLSHSQKMTLVNILVDRVEVITKKSWLKKDIAVKVVLRFDQKQSSQNNTGSNLKSSPLTEEPSKESLNSEIWWRCRGSNPGPSP